MKYASLVEIRLRADVVPLGDGVRSLSRRERLERWAAALEQHQGHVRPLIMIESYSRRERRNLGGKGTPLAVAFADPVLRAEGLRSDSLGDAMNFFELGHGQAHRLLCDCRYSGTMTAAAVAARLRFIAKGGIIRRIWDWGMRCSATS